MTAKLNAFGHVTSDWPATNLSLQNTIRTPGQGRRRFVESVISGWCLKQSCSEEDNCTRDSNLRENTEDKINSRSASLTSLFAGTD